MRRAPLNDIEEPNDMRELLNRSGRIFSERTAFAECAHDGTIEQITYAALQNDVRALATALLARGYGSKRIAIVGENSYAWILSYFAITSSGAVAVPLDKELDPSEMGSQMRRAAVAAICYTHAYADEAIQAASSAESEGTARIECFDIGSLMAGSAGGELLNCGRTLMGEGEDSYDSVVIDPDETCSIQFTSGTTGTSKGVMLSHRNLTADIKGACELVLFTPDDTLLSILPIHHAYEEMAGIFCPLFFGCTVAFCPGPKSLPRCLTAFKPTILCLVPLYVETLCNRIERTAIDKGRARQLAFARAVNGFLHACSIGIGDCLVSEPRAAFGGRLHLIISGGASLDPFYAAYFRSLGITLIQGYGITECSPIVAVNRNREYKDDSLGRTVSCAEISFDDQGQILVRGPLVMQGYLDDAEATAEVLHDGWFSTGDLGSVDADGYVYIEGRSKDLIVLANGKNVMPFEIESTLLRCPSIAEAIVMAGPDRGNGPEHLVAYIHPNYAVLEAPPGTDVADRIRDDIRRANRALLYYKRVARFKMSIEPFEKTTTRKTKRFLLAGDMEDMTDV
jgi:long-chain acyl-CoA synthetase